MQSGKIVIAGAGSIGCFVGGQLGAAGHPVEFLARQRIADELLQHGLTVTDLLGGRVALAAPNIKIGIDPAMLASADIVIVTVKSGATREMAELIGAYGRPGTIVISLQNGVENAATLREVLPGMRVLAGMIPYNVVALGEGRFHRGTDGVIMIESGHGALAEQLTTPSMRVIERSDMVEVAWGKLLINLNNALNALAGIPLRDELSDRTWRRILAQSIEEGLVALRAAEIQPAKVGKVSPHALPTVLRLPNFLFQIVAKGQLRIDPAARSSMWDDLEHHRVTEIDQLQGAIVRLAQKHGTRAPLNEKVLALIKTAEGKMQGSPRAVAKDVWNNGSR